MKVKSLVAFAVAGLFATSIAFAAAPVVNDNDDLANAPASNQLAENDAAPTQLADNDTATGPAMNDEAPNNNNNTTTNTTTTTVMSGTPTPGMSGSSTTNTTTTTTQPTDANPDTATGDDDY